MLRRLGRTESAERLLAETLAVDPLDLWARHLAGRLDAGHGQTEAQTLLDLALEYARIGEPAAAVELFDQARRADADRPLGQTACAVLAGYHAAHALDRLGDRAAAAATRTRSAAADRTGNFASRLDDVAALEAAIAADGDDATALALLGHWCYAAGRTEDARDRWRRSAGLDPTDPVVWRNLALAAFNVDHDATSALDAYDRALAAAPGDPKLHFESDQLRKRIGTAIEVRLDRLEQAPGAVRARDDLAVEYAQLLVSAGRPQDALAVLDGRRFQPWEGGEGQVLRAWERTHLALAEATPGAGAVAHIRAALHPPTSLGEARHPLANPARLLLALGNAFDATDDRSGAAAAWRAAADAVGDFADMSPQPHSENTYFSVLAARRLGDEAYATALVSGLRAYAEALARTPATIDYFATSLPSLLLFDDDPQDSRDLSVQLLRAQLAVLADHRATAEQHLDAVLTADPSHELALDLCRHLAPTGSRS